ncbi:unnamed protein product [Rhizoctonia solani]|uniref:Uncharacterized protein n=1 Tax=Rhizoctonia solani TaxID=456999 RepID=A0A8H3CHV1_9AGAM|nr:unnamed protein product [Rhizoctonia solani]
MKLFVLLGLAVAVLAQDQTQSLGISASASPTATLPITPPSQRPLATCSADPLWRRLRNAQGVDPCALAMNLQQTCTTVDPIVALTGGESYTGPQTVQAATACICTTVMYNLVSGCAACQHQLSNKVTRNWVNWNTWSALCQNRDSIQDGIWNRVTGYNDTIPAWAYTKVFQSDLFDLQQAINIGKCLSSTAGPTSTATSTATPTPEAQTSNNVPIIVGAVLGGVGLILLSITIFFCVLRRRQRKWEENEGVNRPDSTFVIGKPTPSGGLTLRKPSASHYGTGGLFSPNEDRFEKPRPLKTETTLPDVLSDEHQQGKPEYAMPAPTPSYASPPGGFGHFPMPQTQYTPVPNPGVAGVGAGGHGLQEGNRESNVDVNAKRMTMDGPQGAAAQMLAADIAAARAREGAFREDFSAEGPGYQTSTDADGQSHLYRNGTRNTLPTMPNPYDPRNGYNGGKTPATRRYGADQVDEEVHAVSTVDDTSISIYPSSVDRQADHPAPFVGGFSPVPERPREEYQLPERGYSATSSQPSPPLDSDPFGVNRRPTAFNRVFGERSGNMAGIGAGRTSAGSSPTSPHIAQGRVPIAIVSRAGTSPVLNRPNTSPVIRRGPNLGNAAAEMGFGRQHQVAVNALGGPGYRDSSGMSEGSSPTAVGFPGDIGSSRGDGSPLPNGPFAGRSGFGAER